MKTILSLFDYSGRWSRPYRMLGYRTLMVDIKHSQDSYRRILQEDHDAGVPRGALAWCCDASVTDTMTLQQWIMAAGTGSIHGILAAPPCTDFAVSGAQYWKAKDADGRTAASLALVRATLAIIDAYRPAWWALENPVGRLNKLVPELEPFGPWYFQPHWYGDPWTKKTGLWGTFNRNLPRNDVEPIRYNSQGSWTQSLGGKSERTKELRSMTPEGFALAFARANP